MMVTDKYRLFVFLCLWIYNCFHICFGGNKNSYPTIHTSPRKIVEIYEIPLDPVSKYVTKYVHDCIRNAQNLGPDKCNLNQLPRTHIVYHLNGKVINIDGYLDDDAWQDVQWTHTFQDIRGADYPPPTLTTQVKLRWDDTYIYVGARMAAQDIWATMEEHDSLLWKENALEVFFDVDGSMHNYKEIQISARNVLFDLMLTKAYLDRPPLTNRSVVVVANWTSGAKTATYSNGKINDPQRRGTFWLAEMAIPFTTLSEFSTRKDPQPVNNEVWFANFARSNYKLDVVNNTYLKNESVPTDWWSWQSMDAVNFHIPDRWGLIQFKNDSSEKDFDFPRWHIYKALFEVFDALHVYKVRNEFFTDDTRLLKLPPFVLTDACIAVPEIELTTDGFIATIRSKLFPQAVGHIRQDRRIWFD